MGGGGEACRSASRVRVVHDSTEQLCNRRPVSTPGGSNDNLKGSPMRSFSNQTWWCGGAVVQWCSGAVG